jgi:membrane protein DedA with SNARE-associated domain
MQIEWLLHYLQGLIDAYGALGIFVASLIEEMLSIPSLLIAITTSVAVLSNQPVNYGSVFDLIFIVTLPATLGIFFGSFFIYGLAYYLGKPFINKFGKYFGVSWRQIEAAEKKMEESDADLWWLFLARATPILPFALINAFCGVVRWPIASYSVITFFGGMIRVLTVSILAWWIGAFIYKRLHYWFFFEKIVLACIVLSLVTYFGFRFYKSMAKDVEK